MSTTSTLISIFLLINTYLSKLNYFKLLFKLKVIPVPNGIFSIKTSKPSKIFRNFKINSKDRISESNDFEAILRQLIVTQIPICYVESFSELSKMSRTLNWPRSPKTIFTSNSHNSDDVFKQYAARCIENCNAKLIHVSTDCVFSGSKGGYVESDFKDALDVYGSVSRSPVF